MAGKPGQDVRMRGFVERVHPEEALLRLRPLVRTLEAEEVPFDRALGRTLAEDVTSAVDVPAFPKSAVDGYGVRAEETFGAGPTNPIRLRLVGSVFPGRPSPHRLAAGEAIRIMTGGPIPPGVDAVLMAEHAEERQGEVLVKDAVPPGKHVVSAGEDIRKGETLLRAGRVLRPEDIGVLASIGVLRPRVVRRPVAAVATTGNELVTPEEGAGAGVAAVVNSNSYVIESLVRELGGEPIRLPIVRDDPEAVRELVRGFPGDLLVTTGGTSVGLEDWLPVAVAELGELVVHGINVRPGSPSGFGRVGGRPVFLLPGNPVAAMVGFDVLVRPALQWLLGQPEGRRNARVRGPLTRKVVSALNRVDFVRVRILESGAVEPLRSGGAGVLSSMSRADGFVLVPKDLEGYEAGSEVEVLLFQPAGPSHREP